MNRLLPTLAIAGALLGATAVPVRAEADEASAFSKPNAIGLSISTIAGSGVTYRRWFENRMGLQVAAIPFLGVDAAGGTTGFINAGAQVMYAPYKTEALALYGLLGYGIGANLTGSQIDVGLAPGLGADWFFAPNFALSAALGYTFSSTQTSRRLSYGLSPGFTVGGLFYF